MPSGALQPFERRFEARPLLSPASSHRASSPGFLVPHSRQISLSSQISQISSQDENTEDGSAEAPWDVIKWTKLRKITTQAFSEAGKRNFGRPTCIAVSALIAIGTSKGLVLGFDYHQTLKIIIGPGSKSVECGAVTALAIAADFSTVASGHADGHIFTWEINRPAQPFLQIPPIDRSALESPQHEDGHVRDCAILHIAFLGTRHTAIVSADSGGMAFSHIASRGLGPVTRTINSTRLLGRYPVIDIQADRLRKPSTVLGFAPLPLGNVELATDTMGLTALLTPYLLVIVSTTPIAQTQHKSPRPKEISPHSTLSGCLAWFPAVKLKTGEGVSDTKLVYCWSNIVSILEVKILNNEAAMTAQKAPSLEFHLRSRWHAEEAIVAVQWLGRSVLGLLTISQRLLIVEDRTLRVADSVDLLHRHIYHSDLFSDQLAEVVERLNTADPSLHGVVADAFFMSFRAYKGRTFLLGFNDLSVGTLSNWADRLIAMMEAGDHIAALRLATDYYSGNASNITIGLPENDGVRHNMVKEKVLAMITASTSYTFSRPDGHDSAQVQVLAETCFDTCVTMEQTDFLFSEVFDAFEEADMESSFITAMEPYILDNDIKALPPEVVKTLVGHLISENQATKLEELLCLLDPFSFDLDQITVLCRQHSLYDALIYVWTQTIGDHVSPLIELLTLIKLLQYGFANEDITDNPYYESAAKIFPFLAYSLTGRQYPRGALADGASVEQAKSEIYSYLFSGVPTAWPPNSDKIFLTTDRHDDEPAYPYLDLVLKFDAASFMSMLNEAFEDSFLNVAEDELASTNSPAVNVGNGQGQKMTRQHIIEIMLDVMRQGDYSHEHMIYLDMFIARSLPKYPGQLILSGTLLNGALERLCRPPLDALRDDCQLSIEYLLSAHRPPSIAALIDALHNARFFRILKSVYRGERRFVNLLETYFEDTDDREGAFGCIDYILHIDQESGLKQTPSIKQTIARHFQDLVNVDETLTAWTLAKSAPDLLQPCLDVIEDTRQQFVFLRALLEPALAGRDPSPSPSPDAYGPEMVEQYVRTMCVNDPTRVADYVRALPSSDLRLDAVLPAMEASGVVDAAIFVLARDGLARDAMESLSIHLRNLENALTSLIDAFTANPDVGDPYETVNELMEDLEKYGKVGIWLCRGQSSVVQRAPRPRINLAWDIEEGDLDADEYLWLNLLDIVVQVTQNIIAALNHAAENPPPLEHLPLETSQLANRSRANVHEVFTAVLATTATASKQDAAAVSGRSTRRADDMSFLRILRAFLTRAAKTTPSLAELRTVLADILSVYSFEQDVLTLSNQLLGSDLFAELDKVKQLRQHGWRPKTQVCEKCKRRAWGTGIGESVWTEWVAQEENRANERMRKMLEQTGSEEARRLERGKGKASSAPAASTEESQRFTLVVFACRHVYHRTCLDAEMKNASTHERGIYKCQICPSRG
ncbi:uncharacterized protein K489DRAFT_325912 [Dissoconium aciculare CBS 342.82]|uniref:Vacuolar protein sorting-associated protein 8 central domain-containing protein n=1 Tax=Dissoconium aciculare CBS 342.82 TaxID=1314786 RepID=A0A6J3LV39_9PEZI|nr:uncharacterized protein K489DRAFT_325912 [Dissoconium aciculare CBS 342.82]KAF1819630.1 hypothetical protein K489DRAFT_325912 [Dissoconium aciculare CBS 342.82]